MCIANIEFIESDNFYKVIRDLTIVNVTINIETFTVYSLTLSEEIIDVWSCNEDQIDTETNFYQGILSNKPRTKNDELYTHLEKARDFRFNQNLVADNVELDMNYMNCLTSSHDTNEDTIQQMVYRAPIYNMQLITHRVDVFSYASGVSFYCSIYSDQNLKNIQVN